MSDLRLLGSHQAMVGDQCVGTIVCKLDRHRETYRGYIAMLAVRKDYRSKGLGALSRIILVGTLVTIMFVCRVVVGCYGVECNGQGQRG
jgi:GNAT superfamily N-acetyltransferase